MILELGGWIFNDSGALLFCNSEQNRALAAAWHYFLWCRSKIQEHSADSGAGRFDFEGFWIWEAGFSVILELGGWIFSDSGAGKLDFQ